MFALGWCWICDLLSSELGDVFCLSNEQKDTSFNERDPVDTELPYDPTLAAPKHIRITL